jgi:tRNA pseudouridine32 synthase/23S rRNA pseudouridine746 synthase
MRVKSQTDELIPSDLVLWSDDSLLAVNKPAGLLAIPGGYQPEPYLAQILEPAYGRLWVVHRLDRETSGVMVLARTAVAHRALNAQFQEHTTTKVYHALVRGAPEWDQCIVDVALLPNGDRRHRTVVLQGNEAERGKPALTECRVLERFRIQAIPDHYTLLEAIPRTGRTHQIRAHLAHLGTPIVADELYGGGSGLYLADKLCPPDSSAQYRRTDLVCPPDEPERPLLARTVLHAVTLTLKHPRTQETMLFEAPYPEDFAAALRQLRKHRA